MDFYSYLVNMSILSSCTLILAYFMRFSHPLLRVFLTIVTFFLCPLIGLIAIYFNHKLLSIYEDPEVIKVIKEIQNSTTIEELNYHKNKLEELKNVLFKNNYSFLYKHNLYTLIKSVIKKTENQINKKNINRLNVNTIWNK